MGLVKYLYLFSYLVKTLQIEEIWDLIYLVIRLSSVWNRRQTEVGAKTRLPKANS